MRGAVHSQSVPLRGGKVLSGSTCNALLRWQGSDREDLRFDPTFRCSGGKDTIFIDALLARSARFAVSPKAIVREEVALSRLSLRWLARRRFRVGQTCGETAQGHRDRVVRLILAGARWQPAPEA